MNQSIKAINREVYRNGRVVGKINDDVFKSIPQTRKIDTHLLNKSKSYGLYIDLLQFLARIGIKHVVLPLLGRTGATLKCPLWKLKNGGTDFNEKRYLQERDFIYEDKDQLELFS